MKILVTGGAGYIGSHTAIELLASGYDVVLLDNFSNSTPAAVSAIRTVANREVPLVTCDIADGDRSSTACSRQAGSTPSCTSRR